MTEAHPFKVLIVNEHGQYLAGTATRWEFTEERARARVFDYQRDRVPEQIELVKNVYGAIWIAVKLDLREAYEFCDRCGSRLAARQILFDGHQFLCRECSGAGREQKGV
jgi:hypothetical protein